MKLYLAIINCVLLILYVVIAFPLWVDYVRDTPKVSDGFFRRQIEETRNHTREQARLRTNFLIRISNGG